MASNVFYKTVVFGVCLMLLINAPTTQAGWLGAIVGGVATVAGAVVAAPFVLPAAGFTAAGITAGSYAASLMAAAAAGGGVASMAAGGGVAILQSAAAGGAGGVILAGTAGAAGAAVGNAIED